MNKNVLFVR